MPDLDDIVIPSTAVPPKFTRDAGGNLTPVHRDINQRGHGQFAPRSLTDPYFDAHATATRMIANGDRSAKLYDKELDKEILDRLFPCVADPVDHDPLNTIADGQVDEDVLPDIETDIEKTCPYCGEQSDVDPVVIKYVLDHVIDFMEGLVLTGEPLVGAERVLREVEELRRTL